MGYMGGLRQGRGPDVVLVGLLVLCMSGAGDAQMVATVTVQRGVPLHVLVTRSAAMRMGARVEGVLTAPVWVLDRLVLPKGAVVHGVVRALEPVHGEERQKALLNGDVTPLKMPVVDFDRVVLPTGELRMQTEGRVRQTQTVRFTPQAKTSLAGQGVALVKGRLEQVKEAVVAPGKKDRALRLVYGQLPYHPQRVWRDTEMVADLEEPLAVPLARGAEPVLPEAAVLPTTVLVRARLVSALDSDTAKRGDPVEAIVTVPVLNADGALVLPEGAELEGTVVRAKPARSLGRNGSLRFTFKGVQRPGERETTVHGDLAGAEGSEKQNLQVDAEGNVKAQPAKDRFVAPLLLAALAAGGHDEDGGVGREVAASNGLGLVARVASAVAGSKNLAVGFGAYGFAKSIYFRFLTRGHAVTFPKDTLVEVQLTPR